MTKKKDEQTTAAPAAEGKKPEGEIGRAHV